VVGPGLFLLRQEVPPQRGLHADERKELRRNPHPGYALGFGAAIGDVEEHIPEGSHALEDLVLLTPVFVVRRGRIIVDAGVALPGIHLQEINQALGILPRDGPQHHRIQYAEHGAVGPDAQRQYRHHRYGECGIRGQRPGCIAQFPVDCSHKDDYTSAVP